MLDKAIAFLQNRIVTDQFNGEVPEPVVIGAIFNEKGEPLIGGGIVGLMISNIEEERIFKAQLQKQKRVDNDIEVANPEIKLNLYILIAANPGGNPGFYDAALKRLSEVITYFQGTSFFDKTDYPDLDPIEYLSVELYSLSFEQQNQLWASLGGKYMPSVVYKVRLVAIDKGFLGAKQKAILEIDNNLHRKN
jgi:Pvc16 N-terminal domain